MQEEPRAAAPSGNGEPGGAAEPQHSVWLEVFFDLVIVAGVAQIAGLLRAAASLLDVAVAACLFYALWSVWLSITMYSDVAKRQTRTRTILAVMFLAGMMAASIPGVPHGGARTTAFVVAFVVARTVTTGMWRRTGTIMLDWAAAQTTFGIAGWIASIWVPAPWRYLVWAGAIVIEIVASVSTDDAEKFLARFRVRQDEMVARTDAQAARQRAKQVARDQARGRAPRTRPGRERRAVARERERQERIGHVPSVASLDPHHFTERLGLFFVIVLGEAVAEIVIGAAAQREWSAQLGVAALLAFAVLIGIWWITLVRTEDARPLFSPLRLPVKLIVPTHVTMLAGLTALAAGFGAVPLHAAGSLSATSRLLLCAGVGLFALEAAVLMSLSTSRDPAFGRAIRVRAVAGAAIALVPTGLVAWLGGALPTWVVLTILAAVIGLFVAASLVRGTGPKPRRRVTAAR